MTNDSMKDQRPRDVRRVPSEVAHPSAASRKPDKEERRALRLVARLLDISIALTSLEAGDEGLRRYAEALDIARSQYADVLARAWAEHTARFRRVMGEKERERYFPPDLDTALARMRAERSPEPEAGRG